MCTDEICGFVCYKSVNKWIRKTLNEKLCNCYKGHPPTCIRKSLFRRFHTWGLSVKNNPIPLVIFGQFWPESTVSNSQMVLFISSHKHAYIVDSLYKRRFTWDNVKSNIIPVTGSGLLCGLGLHMWSGSSLSEILQWETENVTHPGKKLTIMASIDTN